MKLQTYEPVRIDRSFSVGGLKDIKFTLVYTVYNKRTQMVTQNHN